MKDEYIIEDSWSTGINGNLIYTTLAKEKMNSVNLLRLFAKFTLKGDCNV
jgi:hypothetical protein